MLLFISAREWVDNPFTGFQNIVCYCLSAIVLSIAILFNSFQNIVCYCLSKHKMPEQSSIPISKHRMLLFITINNFCRDNINHFKTSYVTVYRRKLNLQEQLNFISKHRMLLFIHCAFTYSTQSANFKTSYVTVYRLFSHSSSEISGFQNIVCYCLSLTDLLVKGKKNDFKTSYVTVYLLDITVKRI